MIEIHSLLHGGIPLLSVGIILMVWAGTLPSLSNTGLARTIPTGHCSLGRK